MAPSGHTGAVFLAALICATTTGAPAQIIGGAPAADTAAMAIIVGKVVDSSSGGPVSQAQVILRGTSLRTSTDLAGSFTLRRVAPGRYTVEARRIGYEPVVRDDISVGAGERIGLAMFMRPAAFRLAEVTVTPGSFSFLDAGPALRQTRSRAEIEAAPFGEDLFRALNR